MCIDFVSDVGDRELKSHHKGFLQGFSIAQKTNGRYFGSPNNGDARILGF